LPEAHAASFAQAPIPANGSVRCGLVRLARQRPPAKRRVRRVLGDEGLRAHAGELQPVHAEALSLLANPEAEIHRALAGTVRRRTLRWSSARTPSAIVTVIGGRPRRATLPQDHRVDRRATPLRPNARSPRSLPVNNGRQAIDLPPVSASRGAFDFRPSFPAGSADRTTSQACRIRPG